MPGRKPTPTAIKALNGNPGKRPLNEHEPQPKQKRPKMPGHLNEMARSEWRRVLRILSPMGVITEVEADILAIYCSSYARWREALAGLEPHIDIDGVEVGGLIIPNAQGVPMRNPLLKVADDAEKAMLRCMGELGMTPSARARLTAPSNDDDLLERFLLGGG